MYKALEGVTLRQRIQGALVKEAHYRAGVTDPAPDPVTVQFAEMILDDPLRQWQDMVVEVAANGEVQSYMDIDPSGNIDDRKVPDSVIEYVVGAAWGKVAHKVIPSEV